jgi:hypothetical protein
LCSIKSWSPTSKTQVESRANRRLQKKHGRTMVGFRPGGGVPCAPTSRERQLRRAFHGGLSMVLRPRTWRAVPRCALRGEETGLQGHSSMPTAAKEKGGREAPGPPSPNRAIQYGAAWVRIGVRAPARGAWPLMANVGMSYASALSALSPIVSRRRASSPVPRGPSRLSRSCLLITRASKDYRGESLYVPVNAYSLLALDQRQI